MRRLALIALPTLALLTSCGSGPFANPFERAIALTLTPEAVVIAPGSSARVQVTGRDAETGSIVTSLNMTAREVPAGLNVTPSTGAITVTAAPTALAGTYVIPFKASAPGGRGEGALSVEVRAQAYQLAFTPATPSLSAGGTLRVSFTAPAGVRVTNVTGALDATLDADPLGFTLAAPAGQVPGTYTLLVTTTDGRTTQTTPLTVTVTTGGTQ